MRRLLELSLLGMLAACTPPDQLYCQSYGVTGVEFANCLDYYHRKQALFDADRGVCEIEADNTYPPSLYDNGHYEHVLGGFVPTPYGGHYVGAQNIYVPPDYGRNQEVNRLRMRIIEPCMQAKGWNSGSTWKAGSHRVNAPKAFSPAPQPLAPATSLPWKR